MRMMLTGALLCTIFTQQALALNPPPNGWSGAFTNPQIVCDTRQQLEDIFNAGKDDITGKAAEETFQAYRGLMNAEREPTCAMVQIINAAVGESVELGVFYPAPQMERKAWAVHAGNSSAEFWILWMTELPKETSI